MNIISITYGPYRDENCGHTEVCEYTFLGNEKGEYTVRERYFSVPSLYVEVFTQPITLPDQQPFGVWSKHRRNR